MKLRHVRFMGRLLVTMNSNKPLSTTIILLYKCDKYCLKGIKYCIKLYIPQLWDGMLQN